MAKKISNEVKVGALVIITLAIFIFGFNYLRGKGLFNTDLVYHTYFDNVTGLQEAASVQLQGFKVGKVSDIALEADRRIRVEFQVKKDVALPQNVKVQLGSDNLIAGTKSLILVFPNEPSQTFLKEGDYVEPIGSADLLSSLSSNISPILGTANKAVSSIDSILVSIHAIINDNAKNHIDQSLVYLESTMKDMSLLAEALNKQTNNLAGVLNNVNSITNNLSNSNEDISKTLANLNDFTGQLKDAPLDQAINDLQKTIANLNGVIAKANNPDGSVGLMLSDPKLYHNLTTTLSSLDALVTDLKQHPSKYINISIFGKKK
jgi:phospholipid/cholesterol/gamma-HCH transport system substrate-binding protein